MSLTMENLKFSKDMRTLIDTVLANNISNEEKIEMGIDAYLNSHWCLFKVDTVCEKLGITEEELTEQITRLYESSLDTGNIKAHIIDAMVGLKTINEVIVIGIYWTGIIMSAKEIK